MFPDQVLLSSGDTGTFNALVAEMTIVKGCLANPTTSCSTYTGSTTLPVMVKNMEKCMINWKDTTCSGRYTGTDSLPLPVKKVDGCMTQV